MGYEWSVPAVEGSISITSGEAIELALERVQVPSFVVSLSNVEIY